MEVRNRVKGLELIDRVPDELWNEVHDIVQETGIKTISMEKKHKKAKWLSGEALQIAVKRREAKSKGEKERYTHLHFASLLFSVICKAFSDNHFAFLHFFFPLGDGLNPCLLNNVMNLHP